MKQTIVFAMLLLISFFSCNEQGKPLGKKELKMYFADEKVVDLVVAANKGDLKRIDELVVQGADVNYKGKKNITPLYAMLPSLNLNGFKRLLEHGADPNLPTREGESVMWWLAVGDHPAILIDMLRLALEHGGDPNWTFHNDPKSDTIRANEGEPLLAAAVTSERAIEKIKILLQAGADINCKDKEGRTALWYAVCQHYDVIYFLLEAGADYSAKDNHGRNFIWDMEQFPVSTFKGEKNLSEQKQWRAKVVEFLKQKGIEVHLKYPD